MDTNRDFADAFDAAFADLRRQIELACAGAGEWPERAAAAIVATLEFAAAKPAAARLLTSDAFAQGIYGAVRHRQMVAHFAGLLEHGREVSATAAELPDVTEKALVGGLAEVIAERLRVGVSAALPHLSGELIELTLTPYLGGEEARRIAAAEARP